MSSKLKQTRTAQLRQIQKVTEAIGSQLKELHAERSLKLQALQSVSLGLYEELDKLTKKSPVDAVTDLVLSQVNDIVRETKELAKDDVYVQRLSLFVPAGDNPEQRDALVMLRQARQGLDRHKVRLDSAISILQRRLDEVRVLERALQSFLYDGSSIKRGDIDAFGTGSFSDWFYSHYPHEFNFQRLDTLDILTYFAEK